MRNNPYAAKAGQAVVSNLVRRRDLFTGRRYDNVLSLDPRYVDLPRLNAGAPLLNAHGAASLRNVLGVVERA